MELGAVNLGSIFTVADTLSLAGGATVVAVLVEAIYRAPWNLDRRWDDLLRLAVGVVVVPLSALLLGAFDPSYVVVGFLAGAVASATANAAAPLRTGAN